MRRLRAFLIVCNLVMLESYCACLSYQALEFGNLSTDHIQTGAPEVHVLNIDTKAGRQRLGIGHAGRGEEVVVLGAEGVRLLQVAGVQAETEEQAEGIRIVVEGGAIVMTFDSPHVWMQRVQVVAIGLALRIPHSVAELPDGQVAL